MVEKVQQVNGSDKMWTHQMLVTYHATERQHKQTNAVADNLHTAEPHQS